MEAIHITVAKVGPDFRDKCGVASNLGTGLQLSSRVSSIHTFRTPDALLIFQLALIVGPFTIGFLNSPLLYLSRHLAQRPVHRLRWPHKRDMHRKLLSAFFFLFATAFVLGVLGPWVKWMLKGKSPWLWTLTYVLEGRTVLSRPLLLLYWLLLVSGSVTGWQQVVGRSKKFKQPRTSIQTVPTSGVATGIQLQEVREGLHSASGSDKKADTHVTALRKATHLSLNARRKFFHGLAVLIFIPGIFIEVRVHVEKAAVSSRP